MAPVDVAIDRAAAGTASSGLVGQGMGIGFDSVTVAYRGLAVLKDLTLTVHPGEILAIIGPRAPARPRPCVPSPASSAPPAGACASASGM